MIRFKQYQNTYLIRCKLFFYQVQTISKHLSYKVQTISLPNIWLSLLDNQKNSRIHKLKLLTYWLSYQPNLGAPTHSISKDMNTSQQLGYNLRRHFSCDTQDFLYSKPDCCLHQWENMLHVTCCLSSVIAKLMLHVLPLVQTTLFHTILRGWVNCTQFQQNSLKSGLVFVSSLQQIIFAWSSGTAWIWGRLEINVKNDALQETAGLVHSLQNKLQIEICVK